MGAAASALDDSTLLSLDKIKNIAGDQWNDEMESKSVSHSRLLWLHEHNLLSYKYTMTFAFFGL